MTRAFHVYRFLLLVAATLLATLALGWTGVLLVAVAFSVIDRGERVPWESARAAGAAWGLLFLIHAINGLAGPEGGRSAIATVGAVMGLPRVVPPLITILFPTLLAWSAATVAVALLHRAGRSRVVGAQVVPEA